jgi:hypothetical protein
VADLGARDYKKIIFNFTYMEHDTRKPDSQDIHEKFDVTDIEAEKIKAEEKEWDKKIKEVKQKLTSSDPDKNEIDFADGTGEIELHDADLIEDTENN